MITFKRFLREAVGKTAVFAFGRMNPPTIGHAKLIAKVLAVAKKERGLPMVFPSKTEDKKKNPLSFKTKVKVLRDVFGNIINIDTTIKTPFDVLEFLNNAKYEKVIFVVGSDRVQEFKKNMTRYINNDLDNIKDFTVVSAGERDPDAEGVAGMSGSKMREFVIKGQFGKFKEGLMTKNTKLAKVVFKEIGKKFKTKKEI
tara:strand:- start:3686 stop:4282 length:597 start_codon:yes stop_codon:yes gene_type:complete